MQFRAWVLTSLVVLVFLHTAEAAISNWTTPHITGKDGTGKLNVSESQAISETITTFQATSDAKTITYSLETNVTPFKLSNTGDLTITASLDANTLSYTLIVQAVDDAQSRDTGTATITVTVISTAAVNHAPTFGKSSYTKCIANNSPADTTVITVSATDQDQGETITYSIESSGNTNTDFIIDGSTGVIKVNTGKTLDMAKTPTYTLVVKSVDSNSSSKTGTTTVSIEVTADGNCSGNGNDSGGDGNSSGDGNGGRDGNGNGSGNGSGAAAVAVSTMTVLLALFVKI